MRCLVLGGGGFIGSCITDRLLKLGHTVRVFERPRVQTYRDFGKNEKIEWYQGDFQSETDINESVKGCQIAFHLISTTLPKNSNDDPIFDIESNVIGSLRLLSCCVREKIEKIIFISSGGTVYGIPNALPVGETHTTDPLVSYGIAKLTIEKYIHLYYQLHGLPYVILRLSNPFGERQAVNTAQGAVAVFLYKALKGEEIEVWGDGSVTRDYIYIQDVVDAFTLAMNHKEKSGLFNIGSGLGLSLNEVIAEIELLLGREVKKRFMPPRKFDVPITRLDINRAKNILGWHPQVTFQEGLRRTLQWMHGHLKL